METDAATEKKMILMSEEQRLLNLWQWGGFRSVTATAAAPDPAGSRFVLVARPVHISYAKTQSPVQRSDGWLWKEEEEVQAGGAGVFLGTDEDFFI